MTSNTQLPNTLIWAIRSLVGLLHDYWWKKKFHINSTKLIRWLKEKASQIFNHIKLRGKWEGLDGLPFLWVTACVMIKPKSCWINVKPSIRLIVQSIVKQRKLRNTKWQLSILTTLFSQLLDRLLLPLSRFFFSRLFIPSCVPFSVSSAFKDGRFLTLVARIRSPSMDLSQKIETWFWIG